MGCIFKHNQTGKEALWLTEDKPSGAGTDKNILEIRKPSDLPDIPWSDIFNIPPEIAHQGKQGLFSYFRAFCDYSSPVWLWFFPSAFPKGKIDFSF